MEVVGETLMVQDPGVNYMDERWVTWATCADMMVLKCLEEAFRRLWGLDQSRNSGGNTFRGLERR